MSNDRKIHIFKIYTMYIIQATKKSHNIKSKRHSTSNPKETPTKPSGSTIKTINKIILTLKITDEVGLIHLIIAPYLCGYSRV